MKKNSPWRLQIQERRDRAKFRETMIAAANALERSIQRHEKIISDARESIASLRSLAQEETPPTPLENERI